MGIESHGVELNGPLVAYSILNSCKNGTRRITRFYKRDIFKTDLSRYNLAIMFGAEQMVTLLTPKLNEMRKDSHLILCRFPLEEDEPNWKMVDQMGEGIDGAWAYVKLTPPAKHTA